MNGEGSWRPPHAHQARADGTHRPDSAWDFAIYDEERFEPEALRDLGWPGK